MKKLTAILASVILLLLVDPMNLKAMKTSNIVVTANMDSVESAKVNASILRLEAIKAMDRSKMTFSEKRALRKEVKAIKKDDDYRRHSGSGIYLSVGAVIIIILLLLLIF